MTFSLKGLKTITNYQYEPACGILSLLDIFKFHGWCFHESNSNLCLLLFACRGSIGVNVVCMTLVILICWTLNEMDNAVKAIVKVLL